MALAVGLGLTVAGGASVARAGPPEDLVQPVLVEETSIGYPEELLGLEPRPAGSVTVQYVVGIDGVPKELEVVSGVHPVLDRLAVEAVGRLRYRPGTYRGQPVEIVLRTAIEIVPPDVPVAVEPPDVEADELVASEPVAEPPIRVRGRIRRATERTPVQGATVLAVPAPPDLPVGRVKRTIHETPEPPAWSERAFTDDEGRFELRGVPDGRVRLIVLAQGYERLEWVEELAAGEELEIAYYAVPLSSNPYRTVVQSERGEPEVTRRTITPEEIRNLPGTQGDALKSIQNFPGVARAPFGAGLLVIRGSAPSDSRVYLGYHEIPQLFHFGALTSVFNSDILAQIDFIPGNFDPRFGDAIGGVINVHPRAGRRAWHGYVDSDVFDTGAMLEGPVGKGSFVLSGRRSYIDAILPVVIPDDAGLDFKLAPRYWDYQALFDHPLAGGDLSVRVFGSDDRLKLVLPDPNEEDPDESDRFGTVILFHRADVVYRKQHGPWEFLITPSYRHDLVTGSASDVFQFRLVVDNFSGRAEIARQLSRRFALRVGTETIAGQYSIDARAPAVPNFGEGSTQGQLGGVQRHGYLSSALYTTATIGATDRMTFFPGVRLTYNALVFNKMAADPRLRWAWQVGENTVLKGGVGMFSQIPDPFEFNETWGNRDIHLERAVHSSLGVAQALPRWGLGAEATLFHKYMYDLAWFSPRLFLTPGGDIEAERFANSGVGHVAGLEVLLRKDLTGDLFGWVSYTFNRALYRWEPGADYIPFDFDQPHILTVLGVYRLPRNWQIGARFRLVSGNPQDPLQNGILDASDGGYVPIIGDDNSARAPVFHQLDVRVDKRWVRRFVTVGVYLDILNVYNRRNFEAWNYSYDFQQRTILAGLPIIPSLGLRAEF